jgi:hypothetical protein
MTDLLPKLLDFNEVLKDFQYKPNFAYGAYEREGHPWIRVIMLVENARTPFQRWEVKPVPDDERWEIINDRYYPRGPGFIGYSPSRELIEVVGNYPIPKCFYPGDELNFISWMETIIRRVEEHEVYEWMRYKGELINDPHQEV